MFLRRLILLTVVITLAFGLESIAQVNRAVQGSGGSVDATNAAGWKLSGIFGQLAVEVVKNPNNTTVEEVHQGFWVNEPGTDVEDPLVLSENNTIFNFPNPFNNSTTIKYLIAEPSDVLIRIMDMKGTEIMVFNQGYQSQGEYEIIWNAKNKFGDEMSSGTYVYELTVNSISSNTNGDMNKYRNIMMLVK